MQTKAGFKRGMVNGLNARPTECTIKGRCYTHVYKFPRAFLRAEAKCEPVVIVEQEQSKVTLVSDLKGYFGEYSPFRHYSIFPPLRYRVEDIEKEEANTGGDWSPLFLVIEQEVPCETIMGEDTCFIIDEESLLGGTPGREVIITSKTSDGSWPKEEYCADRFVNTVLAAVVIEQKSTEPIEESLNVSCFFDVDGYVVYAQPEPIMSVRPSVAVPMDDNKLGAKADSLKKIIKGLEADMQDDMRTTSRLVAALRLEKIGDDYYLRTWYLRLYEAMLDKLTSSSKHKFKRNHKKNQVKISHPEVADEINKEHLHYLKTDTLEELRSIYRD